MPARPAVEGLYRPDSPLPPLCGCCRRSKKPNIDGLSMNQRVWARQRCMPPLNEVPSTKRASVPLTRPPQLLKRPVNQVVRPLARYAMHGFKYVPNSQPFRSVLLAGCLAIK
jgi:hypothetical protein